MYIDIICCIVYKEIDPFLQLNAKKKKNIYIYKYIIYIFCLRHDYIFVRVPQKFPLKFFFKLTNETCDHCRNSIVKLNFLLEDEDNVLQFVSDHGILLNPTCYRCGEDASLKKIALVLLQEK